MTLAVYPLVYLPVAASLRSADPSLEEVSRSLGVGRLKTFFRITLGQARGAILGGCVLVALVILAEYGAFEILDLPDVHHRDLHRVRRVPGADRLCALTRSDRDQRTCAGWRCRGPGPYQGRSNGPFAQRIGTRHASSGERRSPCLPPSPHLSGSLSVCPSHRASTGCSSAPGNRLQGTSLLSSGLHTALYGVRRSTGNCRGPSGSPACGPARQSH